MSVFETFITSFFATLSANPKITMTPNELMELFTSQWEISCKPIIDKALIGEMGILTNAAPNAVKKTTTATAKKRVAAVKTTPISIIITDDTVQRIAPEIKSTPVKKAPAASRKKVSVKLEIAEPEIGLVKTDIPENNNIENNINTVPITPKKRIVKKKIVKSSEMVSMADEPIDSNKSINDVVDGSVTSDAQILVPTTPNVNSKKRAARSPKNDGNNAAKRQKKTTTLAKPLNIDESHNAGITAAITTTPTAMCPAASQCSARNYCDHLITQGTYKGTLCDIETCDAANNHKCVFHARESNATSKYLKLERHETLDIVYDPLTNLIFKSDREKVVVGSISNNAASSEYDNALCIAKGFTEFTLTSDLWPQAYIINSEHMVINGIVPEYLAIYPFTTGTETNGVDAEDVSFTMN